MTNYAPLFAATYLDGKGKAILASRFAWSKLLRWQKKLIDYYGYDKVVRFQAGLGDEFSPSNAFEVGKIAMLMDGEWRVAFIAAEHPKLNYGTAPMPVDDAHPNLYGAGSVNGTIIGIPKGGKHADEAWALVKYLTTNDHALAKFSNGIRNVPSTRTSAKSSELKPDPRFQTFIRIFNNPNSATAPITAAGNANLTLVGRFTVKWQAGKVKNLHDGLKKLDRQIDAQNAQASAFGVALMLARARLGLGFFRTVFYLPALAPPVAATLGFVYLLNPATGPINTVLGHLGIQGPLWFQSPSWAKPSLALLSLWGVGNTMIIFLAAILDVPRHLYESAELDGAGAARQFVHVTLPSISPVILFAVVIGVIQGLQYFTQAYVAANIASGQASQAGDTTSNLGYPEDSTLFYPVLLYQNGFRYFQMGYASAMAMLLLGVSLAVTLVIIV